MPPLPSPLRACPASSWAVTVLLLSGGCASAPSRPDAGTEPPQVLVELLPRRAELRVDGAVLGRGGRVVPVPDPVRRYRIAASAPGFAPAERAEAGAQLAGARVVLALRPSGLGGAGVLDGDDPQALAAAAEALLRGGDRDAAREYAVRAASLAPDAPSVRQVLAATGAAEPSRTIEVEPKRGSQP